MTIHPSLLVWRILWTEDGQGRITKRGQRFRGLSVPLPGVTDRLPTDQETKVPKAAFQTRTVWTTLEHPTAVTARRRPLG